MKTIGQAELNRVIEFLKEHGPPAREIAARPAPRPKGVKPQAKTDPDVSAIDAQFRIAMADLRASAGVLAEPVVTRQVLLDKPFLIWSYPLSEILVSSTIESLNSAARLSFFANQGGANTRFTFHFFWTNENPSPAVVVAHARLVFTGDCFAQARAGVLSGYKTTISLGGRLHMLRAGGWGSDPLAGNQTFVPQTQGISIASLEAEGGHIFQGPGTDSQSFAGQPFDLSSFPLLVPSGASVIFQPSLYLYCSLEGDTLEDVVDIDFATNGRAMRCPFVMLTVQTPT
jgi:hypothetical protein